MNKYQLNYNYIKKHIKINLVLDECWIYFNSRNFDKNFKGENAKILDYIYQPRKINILLQLIVQNPSEIDVKFRRLAMWYRKYYRGFFFIRWFKDYYFPNPDNIDFEKAEVTNWWFNFNFYPLYPRLNYETKELIFPWEDIYEKWSLFKVIKEKFPVSPYIEYFKKPWLFDTIWKWLDKNEKIKLKKEKEYKKQKFIEQEQICKEKYLKLKQK